MSQQLIEKELELNFSTEDIKSKIDKLIEVNKGNYQLKEKNDVFNTYRIGIVSGLNTGILTISLTSVDDGKTKFNTQITKAAGGVTKTDYNAILSRLQDDFLKVLSEALSGKEITKEMIKGNKSGGCLGLAIILISISSIVAYSI
jgi:hypothetical protein